MYVAYNTPKRCHLRGEHRADGPGIILSASGSGVGAMIVVVVAVEYEDSLGLQKNVCTSAWRRLSKEINS